jgi:succinate-acetate transporter protein
MNEILVNLVIVYGIFWLIFAIALLLDYFSDKIFAYPYDLKISMASLNIAIGILLLQVLFTFLIIFYYLLTNIDKDLALAIIFSVIAFSIILGFLEGSKKEEKKNEGN